MFALAQHPAGPISPFFVCFWCFNLVPARLPGQLQPHATSQIRSRAGQHHGSSGNPHCQPREPARGGLGFSSAASEQAERRQQPQQLGRPWAMRRLPSREGNSSFKGGQRGRQQQAAALTLLEASTALKPAGSPGLRFNSACREDEQTAEPSKFAALEAPLERGQGGGEKQKAEPPTLPSTSAPVGGAP